MLDYLTKLFNEDHLEVIDKLFNRIGLGSIGTTAGVTYVQAAQEVQEIATIWGLPQYALLISAIGGVLFCIEKAIVIYFRLKNK